MDDDFLGRGWEWPIRLDGAGGVALVSAEREVEQSIVLILSTVPGERPMRPEFGCALLGSVFAPADATTAGVIREAVSRALERWEPRIAVEGIRVATDRAPDLVVEIDYVVRATNDRRNLVFPYYVLPDERVVPTLPDPGVRP